MKTFKTTLVMLCVFVLGYIFINQVDVSAEEKTGSLVVELPAFKNIEVGEEVDLKQFITITDNGEDITEDALEHIADNIDFDTIGEYIVGYMYYDKYTKKYDTKNMIVTIKEDATPPIIICVHDTYIFDTMKEAEEYNYLADITTYDEKDNDVKVEVSKLKGEYYVEVTATDNSDNSSIKKITVHIMENLPDLIISLDKIYLEVKQEEPDYLTYVQINDEYKGNINIEIIESNVNIDIVGKYTVLYKARLYNISEQKIIEVYVDDTVKPKISGEKNIKLKKDSLFYWDKYFTVKDNYDRKENIGIEIEGHFDIKETGDYNLVLRATDSSGNIARYPFTLTIANKGSSFIVWTAIIACVIAIGAGGTLIYFKKFKRD